MFKDEVLESVVIVSDLKEDKYVRDQFCQTKDLVLLDKGCQSLTHNNVEVQTNFEQALPQSTRMKIDNSKNLISFMLSVYPSVSEQLLANIRSHAFDGYEVDWEDSAENKATHCMHTMQNKEIHKDQTITSIDWNSTGSLVAAAYGSVSHESWCVHQSSICLWNIDRNNLNENKADKVIDSDSCIMTISFHKSYPGLLAGGDFSGKIRIWDLSEEDNMLVAYSGNDVLSHQEATTKLIWGETKGSRSFELISVGNDGKILFWDYNQLKQKLTLNKKFILRNENIPRAFRHSVSKSDLEIGISCLSFSPKSYNTIYLGTESGGIFRCLTESKNNSNHSRELVPVVQGFVGHTSTVNAIDASPHFRNIFISCSSDMKLHIYSSDTVNPLIVIEPSSEYLLGVQWSPIQSTTFCVTTSLGSLLIYNLMESHSLPADSVKLQKHNSIAHALSFNSNRATVIATGDASNEMKIWKLGDCFGKMKEKDEDFFQRLLTEDL